MNRRLRFMWYKHDSVDSEHIALMNWNFIEILVLGKGKALVCDICCYRKGIVCSSKNDFLK